MRTRNIAIPLVLLAAFAASGCATADRSGLSFHEGRDLAQQEHAETAPEKRNNCSKTTRVGSNMRQIVCRSQDVRTLTSERAQNALRNQSHLRKSDLRAAESVRLIN